MPVSPDDARKLAVAIREIFAEAEDALVADIARRLAAGDELPDWAARKLAELNAVRAAATRAAGRAQVIALEADHCDRREGVGARHSGDRSRPGTCCTPGAWRSACRRVASDQTLPLFRRSPVRGSTRSSGRP